MMKLGRASALLALLSVAMNSCAQFFNQRFDPYGGDTPEVAWNLEVSDSALHVFYGGWDSVPSNVTLLGRLTFTYAGSLVDSSRYLTLGKYRYMGWANSGIRLANGNMLIGGSTLDLATITSQATLYLFGADGDTLWTRDHGDTSLYWIGGQARQDLDGGFLLAGDRRDQNPPTRRVGFLIKFDSLGNYLWDIEIAPGAFNHYMNGVAPVGDHQYCVSGFRAQGTIIWQWIAMVDSSGTIHWSHYYGPSDDGFGAQITGTADGNILNASGFNNSSSPITRPHLMKLDPAGNVLWDRKYGAPQFGTGFFTVTEVTPGGDLIACGTDQGSSVWSGLLLRTNSQGDSLWMRRYTYMDSLFSDGEGRFYDVQPMPDGGFVATGPTYFSDSLGYPPGYSQDVWLVRVDSMGCLVPGCHLVTGIETQNTNYRDALRVSPNPVAAGQPVTVELAQPCTGCRLSVVSATGQLVHETLVSGQRSTLHVQPAPGLYFLHLVREGAWLGGAKLVVE